MPTHNISHLILPSFPPSYTNEKKKNRTPNNRTQRIVEACSLLHDLFVFFKATFCSHIRVCKYSTDRLSVCHHHTHFRLREEKNYFSFYNYSTGRKLISKFFAIVLLYRYFLYPHCSIQTNTLTHTLKAAH
uniref:(northern house mosquito) hypothetical protein n=1 Tax=Culex pipiens TaxID=7175 RepID=A0A8D8AGV6_CULPI